MSECVCSGGISMAFSTGHWLSSGVFSSLYHFATLNWHYPNDLPLSSTFMQQHCLSVECSGVSGSSASVGMWVHHHHRRRRRQHCHHRQLTLLPFSQMGRKVITQSEEVGRSLLHKIVTSSAQETLYFILGAVAFWFYLLSFLQYTHAHRHTSEKWFKNVKNLLLASGWWWWWWWWQWDDEVLCCCWFSCSKEKYVWGTPFLINRQTNGRIWRTQGARAMHDQSECAVGLWCTLTDLPLTFWLVSASCCHCHRHEVQQQ